MIDQKPCVVGALEQFDYPIRVAALRLMGSGDGIDAALDDIVADPKLLRQVVKLLSHMAYAGLLEYYGGWDDESAHWTISREHALAEDLSTIEAQLLQTYEGTDQLKTEEFKAEMAQREAEARAAMQAVDVERARPRPPQLPPGTPISLRGLAILRQREREE